MAHRETGAAFRRGDRPLSPHLQVYRLQITMLTSGLHRIAGVGLALGAAMVVWWFIALAWGPEAFAAAQGFWGSIVGQLLQLGFAFGLSWHFLNGVRHLFWDAGYGLGIDSAVKTGWAVAVGSVVLTLALVIFA